jgi:hypothetical protein
VREQLEDLAALLTDTDAVNPLPVSDQEVRDVSLYCRGSLLALKRQ